MSSKSSFSNPDIDLLLQREDLKHANREKVTEKNNKMSANKSLFDDTDEELNEESKRSVPLNVVRTYGPSPRAPIKQNDNKAPSSRGGKLASLLNTEQSSSYQTRNNTFDSMITDRPKSYLWNTEIHESPLENRNYTQPAKPLFSSLFRNNNNNNLLSEIRKTDLTKVKEDKTQPVVNKESLYEMLKQVRDKFIMGGFMQSEFITFNDNMSKMTVCDKVLQSLAKSDSEDSDIFERPRTRACRGSTDLKWTYDYISNDINSRDDSKSEDNKNDPSYTPPANLLSSSNTNANNNNNNNKKRARKKNLSRDAGPNNNNARKNQGVMKNMKTDSEETTERSTVSEFIDVSSHKSPRGESKMSYLQQGSYDMTQLDEEDEVEKAQCPICQQSFSKDSIEAHASECNSFFEDIGGRDSPPGLSKKVTAGYGGRKDVLSGGVTKRAAEKSKTDNEHVIKRFHFQNEEHT